MAASYYLINGVTISSPGGGTVMKAGELVSDPGTISAIQAAGGILVPSNNAVIAAAAASLTKQYAKGMNQEDASRIMMAAYDHSGGGLLLRFIAASIAASATLQSQPAMFDRPATIEEAKFMCFGTPAAGESVVLQARKNGTDITGATITYDSTGTPKTEITIPKLAGVSFVEGDALDVVVTYTAGGTPALGTGQNGYFDLWMRTQ